MKKFIGVLICFIILVVAGAAYATNSEIFTQQDQERTQCDIGVPCVFQVVTYQFTANATTDFVIPNVRDVANMKAPLFIVNKKADGLLTQFYLHIDPGSQSVLNSVNETKIDKEIIPILHIDPGNC